MLKNLKVTTKLVAILVAPVLVLVALAFVGVRQRQADAAQAQRVLALTEFVGATREVLKQVELEGLLAARVSGTPVGSDGAIKAEYAEQQPATDAAVARFRELAAEVDDGDSQEVTPKIETVKTLTGGIGTTRSSVVGRSIEGTQIVDENYQNVSKAIVEAIQKVGESLDDPTLSRRMTSVAAVAQLGAAHSHAANALAVAAEVGYFPAQQPKISQVANALLPAEFGGGCGNAPSAAQDGDCVPFESLRLANSEIESNEKAFSAIGSPDDQPQVRRNAADTALDDYVKKAIEMGEGKDPTYKNDLTKLVPAAAFAGAAEEAIKGYDQVTGTILSSPSYPESVASIASARASEAQQAALVYLFFAVASIAVAALVTLAVGRSITVPLRRLTNAAYTLSTDRLPALVERLRNPEEESHEALTAMLAPIDIHSRDEIGQLADSFNSIQQVTIEVAEEQSVLLRKGIGDIFINLARRNQTLLDRQIEFIDQLEANEEDPDQLDNLFKLDHLATRMRRNAESLLVLAGAEPPRRRGRPVALADVVRVAIGEVEDFARIQLLALDDATVGGNVAVDLAHLLSELMENATHFSPPDTMVEIVGHRSANGYIISVSDQGIGMSPEQLAEANHQLARPPLVGLALSRSLGFIVIGRLAQRFEISAKLTASPSGGVTALVTLPPDLVSYEGEDAPPAHAPMGAPGQSGMMSAHDPNDVVVIDPDLSLVDERYGQSYDYQPPAPGYEPPAPSYEPTYQPPAPGYHPVGRAGDHDDEFDRGLQEILGEDHQGHAIAGTIYDDPGYDPAPSYDDRSGYTPSGYAQPTYEPSAPAYEPPAPAYEPPAPVYEPPAPAYEPPAPVYEAPARVQPIQTVAEQIAAASRAEASTASLTAAGLVRRTPKKRSDQGVGGGSIAQAPRATNTSQRSPEEVRKMLSRYRSGLNKGRNSADPEKADS